MNSFKTAKGTVLPLMQLQDKPYLQPAHRLVWFREEKPLWSIVSRYLDCPEGFVLAEVEVWDDAGKLMARAHKMERFEQNAYESAETGAMGRALAWLGYGTQFAGEADAIVDAPIPTATKPQSPKNFAPPPPAKANGAYRCDFGKHNGKTLDEISKPVAEMYAEYLVEEAAKSGKPLSGKAKVFVDQVCSKWPPMTPPPKLNTEEKLPF